MMIRTVFKGILLVGVAVIVLYVGFTVYENFFARHDQPTVAVADARFSVVILNTRTQLFTDKYDVSGLKAGERKYTLHGYWEQAKGYRYIKRDIVLDEHIFGEIRVTKREAQSGQG